MVVILTDKQQRIVEILKINPYITQQDLADMIGLSRSATANLITSLVNKGIILGKAYILNTKEDDLVVCVGGSNIDSKLIHLTKNELYTSNPVTTSISVGGVIRNIAENLGRLGCKVSLMSMLGHDEDGRIIEETSRKFMSFDQSEIINQERTGRYTAVLDVDGELIMGLADMHICELMDKNWIDRHKSHLIGSSYIIVDTNIKKSGLERLIQISKEHDLKLIINGVSAPKTKRIPQDIDSLYMVIMNLDESQAYLQTEEEDLSKIVQLWFEKGVKNVIVTNSIHGIGIGSNQKEINLVKPLIAQHVSDVTGAGDSFSAGLVYGLLQGSSLEKAVEYAKVTSYLTVQTKDSVRSDLTKELLEREKEKISDGKH